MATLPAALTGNADAICIDLEDAVPPPRKAEARASLIITLAGLADVHLRRLLVRVNSLRSLDGLADISALLLADHAPRALMLPKVESADEVRWASALAADARSDIDLTCIIETTAGLEQCHAIAAADSRLIAIFFGGFDLSTALGAEMAWEPLLYARSRVVHAAAAAGLQVIDSPHLDINDVNGLSAIALRAKALGMTGKTAKHPSQIETINAAFSPTAEELAYARKVVDAFRADPAAALVVDGKLIELPTIKRLQRIAGVSALDSDRVSTGKD